MPAPKYPYCTSTPVEVSKPPGKEDVLNVAKSSLSTAVLDPVATATNALDLYNELPSSNSPDENLSLCCGSVAFDHVDES